MILDSTEGGAGHGSRRFFRSLQMQKRYELRWAASKGVAGPGGLIAEEWPSLGSLGRFRLETRFARGERRLRLAETRFHESNMLRVIAGERPDALSLQNIHGYMSFRFVEKLPHDMPILWTLRDMWPLTGHCCYSFECDEYLCGCERDCGQSDRWGPILEKPDREWQRRQKFLEANHDRITLAAPSRWLTELARKRFGDAIRVHWIPNTVELDEFRPVGDRPGVRRILGLPVDAHLVLAGAKWIGDARKGMRFLLEAFEMLEHDTSREVRLVVFGQADAQPDVAGVIAVGVIRDPALLNLYYNACDVYALPSLADNLPNTLLESTAAGTPCVVFRAGGCPEVVREGLTGFAVEPGDAAELAAALERVLAMAPLQAEEMRRNCRMVAETDYALEIQGRQYAEAFAELIGE